MSSLKKFVPSSVKKAINGINFKYRQATSDNRCLPDFIIIGAQRSGTSSMFYYLNQHIDIVSSYEKEVHFFDGGLISDVDNYQKGEAWYRTHFPLKKSVGKQQKIFETSPFYMLNPLTPKRISELTPDVKIIALMRNPTERAISQYFHEKKTGVENLSMLEAFQAEEERLAPIIDNEDYKNDIFIHYSYKSRGRYIEHIKRYLNYFSMENVLLINSEKFFTSPEETLKSVYDFVGVDSEFKIQDLKPRSVGSNRTNVDPKVYAYLEDYFRPYNEELYELVGENYGW